MGRDYQMAASFGRHRRRNASMRHFGNESISRRRVVVADEL
jgi:hypothetical protein